MTPPRPRLYADDIVAAAAAALAPAVAQWLGENIDESLVAGLAKAMRWDTDGYVVAKALERSWLIDPDAALVEILDEAGGHLLDAYRKAVTAWVIANNITPQHAVGDRVGVDHNGTIHAGTITRIVPDDGMYVVNVPALGHVVEGIGTNGIFVPFEGILPPPPMA